METPTASDPRAARRAAARALVARVAYLLYDRRMTELQGGNMSVRIGDEVVITPTLASENDGWRLGPDDMVIHDLDGGVRDGDPRRVSRETGLHLRLYRAYPELGSVYHLHLPEALAAAARWTPGIVAAGPEPWGVPVVLLEPGLPAQTEAHDGRVEELLGHVPRADGAVSISPGHGIISVARDAATNIRGADILRLRLEHARIRGRLRAAAGQGIR
ncbi:MAG: class II aldolase/adducin family protein [Chloroflexota bacterium]